MKELYINKNEKKMEKTINELIVDAMGNRTIKQFAKDCGLDTILLQQILRNTKLITPDILKKIANNAQNQDEVYYAKLLNAAGFINDKDMEECYFIVPEDLNDIPIAYAGGVKDVVQEDLDQLIELKKKIEERNNSKDE